MERIFRRFMLALSAFAFASVSWAQSYPVKPIRFVIGFPPGTAIDSVARLVGNEVEKRLGQPIVLDFKPGANGTIGAKSVVTATPDGYTLLYGVTATLHPVLTRNNAVDAARDLVSVSHFTSAPYFILSRASLPVTSLKELVAYAKANPDSLKHGAQSAATDLVMQMLRDRTGIASRSIPYKASPQTVAALLAGEVDLGAASVQPFVPHIRAGTIRALFVASSARSSLLPSVPTAAEVGLDNFELAINAGLWAPLGTSREIVQKLASESAAVLRMPAIAEQIRKVAAVEPRGSTPEEQLRVFESDIRFWSEAARLANFQPK